MNRQHPERDYEAPEREVPARGLQVGAGARIKWNRSLVRADRSRIYGVGVRNHREPDAAMLML